MHAYTLQGTVCDRATSSRHGTRARASTGKTVVQFNLTEQLPQHSRRSGGMTPSQLLITQITGRTTGDELLAQVMEQIDGITFRAVHAARVARYGIRNTVRYGIRSSDGGIRWGIRSTLQEASLTGCSS
jgi:hypothetical protein